MICEEIKKIKKHFDDNWPSLQKQGFEAVELHRSSLEGRVIHILGMLHPNNFGLTKASHQRLVEESQKQVMTKLETINPTLLGVEGALDTWGSNEIIVALSDQPSFKRTTLYCIKHSIKCFGLHHIGLQQVMKSTVASSLEHIGKRCESNHINLLLKVVRGCSEFAFSNAVSVIAQSPNATGAMLMGSAHIEDFQELAEKFDIRIEIHNCDPEGATRI